MLTIEIQIAIIDSDEKKDYSGDDGDDYDDDHGDGHGDESVIVTSEDVKYLDISQVWTIV